MDFTNGSQKAGEQIFGFNMLLLSCVHWQELPTTSDSANCARFSKSVTASGTSNDNSTVKSFLKKKNITFEIQSLEV